MKHTKDPTPIFTSSGLEAKRASKKTLFVKLVFFCISFAVCSGASMAQSSTEFELQRLQQEVERVREEMAAQAFRDRQRRTEEEYRDRQRREREESSRSMEASRIDAKKSKQSELDYKHKELQRSLAFLEDAQKTRLLSKSEVLWLSNRIDYLVERQASIVNADMSFFQKKFQMEKMWDLPYVDRMALIRSREKERWTQAGKR